ncbi:ATP-dependent DNA helicase [Rhodoligotrophos defluvii]|uniref:ATP-dependent DNA helicase n=1 Tax=Rhodoligotrophos defluvii TaxID=2561934 RepID=UPI0010C95C4E|nr:ATP-dependent DNA helicase [Rhodoligotrophos defluvii]
MAFSSHTKAELHAPDAVSAFPAAALQGVELLVSPAQDQLLDQPAQLDAEAGLACLAAEPHLVCHAVFLANRLQIAARAERTAARAAREQAHYDVAELFAFVCPARFALPTPAGIARALGLDPGAACPTALLRECARCLLAHLAAEARQQSAREMLEQAQFLARSRWPWAPLVIQAIEEGSGNQDISPFLTGLNVWDRLAEWEDEGPRPQPDTKAIPPEDVERELARILGNGSETRTAQRDYSVKVSQAFAPRTSRHENHILLAEAGTGLGKTLGYLAPAALWARRNSGTVWISTYTKNLQRQLEQETQKVFPSPEERRRKVVIRKGRENYLCLLNLQERIAQMSGNPRGNLLAVLIVRWVKVSRDGDMIGGDFPAWLMSLFADGGTTGERAPSPANLGLTDRRGECIYTACPHYRKCFVEKATRAARKADIVIGNHALVMAQAAQDQLLGPAQTTDEQTAAGAIRRLILDEGHHLFDAADNAFAAHLTAIEAAELRRWIRGGETRGRRGRSLIDRIGDLAGAAQEDDQTEAMLQAVMNAANNLPGPGWQRRVQAGMPEGPAERFLMIIREQVLARSETAARYALETGCRPPLPGLAEAADALAAALQELAAPMQALAKSLMARLDDDAAKLETAERARIESVARGLRRRAELTLNAWIDMLDRLSREEPEGFAEWFAIEQSFGQEADVGMYRHWIDPTVPLAKLVLETVDGAVITSATLRDRLPEAPDDWASAEMRTGVNHLPYPAMRSVHHSPYDYPNQARIVIVNDVNREDPDQVAAAYRELFLAAGGGALGLFTAISRLRETYRRIIAPLSRNGLSLYAQHVDPVDTGTLVDLFRAEQNSCLLGTDAVRDGVDVPGEALRLIVLERVPWPQPSILERARRAAFGGNIYQEMIVRLRLRQAFGRLIRRADDRGVFVVLDPRLASRFLTAFPEGVPVKRTGLVDAIETVQTFLAERPC